MAIVTHGTKVTSFTGREGKGHSLAGETGFKTHGEANQAITAMMKAETAVGFADTPEVDKAFKSIRAAKEAKAEKAEKAETEKVEAEKVESDKKPRRFGKGGK